MYYVTRWYACPERQRRNPALGRFVQADTLVPEPGNPLAWDRYAYVQNNPLRYTDPSGRFSEEAIWNYLLEQYGERRARILLQRWRANDDWWAMLRQAGAGDILYGQGWLYPRDGGLPSGAFSAAYQFEGRGQSRLEGITPSEDTAAIPGFGNASLERIRSGRWDTASDRVVVNWRGVVRLGEDPISTTRLVYTRYADKAILVTTLNQKTRERIYVGVRATTAFTLGLVAIKNPLLAGTMAVIFEFVGPADKMGRWVANEVPLRDNDYYVVSVGPVEFTTQLIFNGDSYAR